MGTSCAEAECRQAKKINKKNAVLPFIAYGDLLDPSLMNFREAVAISEPLRFTRLFAAETMHKWHGY